MNANRKFHFIVILALAAILLLSLTAQVSAAQPSEPHGSARPAAQAECGQVLMDAGATLARIEMPNTRADYAALERIAECQAVAGVSIIPVTGRPDSAFNRFLAVKDLQAEMAAGAEYPRTAAPTTGYFDKFFMEFKLRQAERMSR